MGFDNVVVPLQGISVECHCGLGCCARQAHALKFNLSSKMMMRLRLGLKMMTATATATTVLQPVPWNFDLSKGKTASGFCASRNHLTCLSAVCLSKLQPPPQPQPLLPPPQITTTTVITATATPASSQRQR